MVDDFDKMKRAHDENVERNRALEIKSGRDYQEADKIARDRANSAMERIKRESEG